MGSIIPLHNLAKTKGFWFTAHLDIWFESTYPNHSQFLTPFSASLTSWLVTTVTKSLGGTGKAYHLHMFQVPNVEKPALQLLQLSPVRLAKMASFCRCIHIGVSNAFEVSASTKAFHSFQLLVCLVYLQVVRRRSYCQRAAELEDLVPSSIKSDQTQESRGLPLQSVRHAPSSWNTTTAFS